MGVATNWCHCVQAKACEELLDAACQLRCVLNDKLHGSHYSADWSKVRSLELLCLLRRDHGFFACERGIEWRPYPYWGRIQVTQKSPQNGTSSPQRRPQQKDNIVVVVEHCRLCKLLLCVQCSGVNKLAVEQRHPQQRSFHPCSPLAN